MPGLFGGLGISPGKRHAPKKQEEKETANVKEKDFEFGHADAHTH